MEKEKVCLGAIVGVHGIRGEVKVKSFSDDERHLVSYGVLTNEKGDQTFDIKIVGHSKDLLRVKIKGVDDRNTAEALVGTGFYISRDVLPDLEDDEYYHADLIGIEVRNNSNEVLGEVNAIYNFGAGDLIEIKLDNGQLEMLPFTAQFVPTINIKEHFIIVEMMQFAPEDEDEGNEG